MKILGILKRLACITVVIRDEKQFILKTHLSIFPQKVFQPVSTVNTHTALLKNRIQLTHCHLPRWLKLAMSSIQTVIQVVTHLRPELPVQRLEIVLQLGCHVLVYVQWKTVWGRVMNVSMGESHVRVLVVVPVPS